jgi:hypothetical protein
MNPPRPRGLVIHHEDCLALNITALAGYLKPGVHTGRLELTDLSGRFGSDPWLLVQVSLGASTGELAIEGYDRGAIGLVRVPTAIGPLFRLVCPGPDCGKAVRRLYLPRCDRPELRAFAALFGDPFWWCRSCHGIRYRRARKRDAVAEASRTLAQAIGLQQEIAVQVQVARSSLALTRSLAASASRGRAAAV